MASDQTQYLTAVQPISSAENSLHINDTPEVRSDVLSEKVSR